MNIAQDRTQRLIRDIPTMRSLIASSRQHGGSIGFVPTMGALHEGHLSLIRQSARDNSHTVVSVFVNPIQFGPGEDFEAYPRTLDDDANKAFDAGGNVVFTVSRDAMYPSSFSTFVDEETRSQELCGHSRPGHFRGVTTVCLKLFQIVDPDRAYFGQKDWQQSVVLRQMIRDLNLDLEMHVLPTVRESDGLAMSSRNAYLDPEQRQRALCLRRGLEAARQEARDGQEDLTVLTQSILRELEATPGVAVDYVRILERDTLAPLDRLDRPAVAAAAIHLGPARLIDNIFLEPPAA